MPAPQESGDSADQPSYERIRKWEIVGSVAQTFFKIGGLVLIAYWAKGALSDMAGKTTLADIGLRGDFRISDGIAWIFGGGGVAWGALERSLRHRHIERTTRRVVELETQIDPGRTSSQLTRTGQTNPRDLP